MCEVLRVKRSSCYRWLSSQKKRCMREEEEKRDIERIEAVFEESDRIWGYRNITKELQSRGMEISEYRVRRLMKENGFYPELAVKFKPQRNGKKDGRYYENKVNQEFNVKEKKMQGSMSRPGCPYDNSCVESFFASLKKEKMYRREYATMEEVKKDVFWYIEMFYNRKRRHSTLKYMTPIEYLRKYDEIGVA